VVNSKESKINRELTKCQETIVCVHKQDCGFGIRLRCVAEELAIRHKTVTGLF
jgi:hypothetical protein